MIHSLKVWPFYFAAISSGEKTFELRKNDRNFKPGDILRLQEYEHIGFARYTGREIYKRIGFMIQGEFGLHSDVCCMSLHDVRCDVCDCSEFVMNGIYMQCANCDEVLEMEGNAIAK